MPPAISKHHPEFYAGLTILVHMANVRATTTLVTDHFDNAKLYRDQAQRIEAIYSPDHPNKIPHEDKRKHRAASMNSVISTACFLESTINALFWKFQDDHHRLEQDEDAIHFPERPEYRQAVIEAQESDSNGTSLSERRKRAGIIGQYNIFLDVIGENQFSKDETPLEPVDRVLDIRNELVHFESRWIEGGEKDHTGNEYGFEESLQGRFDLNPLMASGNAFFPDQCLGYGCAEWSFRVSRGFVHHFSQRIDLQIHPDISLPW